MAERDQLVAALRASTRQEREYAEDTANAINAAIHMAILTLLERLIHDLDRGV